VIVMTESLDAITVGEIVATDLRAASVFEHFGIDFCCGGRRSLADACRAAGVDPGAVRAALDSIAAEITDADAEVGQWPLGRLIDHIVSTHHAYVRVAMHTIAHQLATVARVHGGRHPELARVAAAFDELQYGLQHHLTKEEQVLFPYIRELATRVEGHPIVSPFGTVANPIRMMEREHGECGDGLRRIRELTNGYALPADGCMTYRAAFEELVRFERDLHRHVHLENNVLFPQAIALEQQLSTGSFDA